MSHTKSFALPFIALAALALIGAAIVVPSAQAQSEPTGRSVAPASLQPPVYFMPDATGTSFNATGRDVQARPEPGQIGLRLSDGSVVTMHFPGSNATIHPQGQLPATAVAHDYRGSSPDEWRENIPLYAAVIYEELYPGIDLRIFFSENQLKSEFVIHPGASLAAVEVRYEGVEMLNLSPQGLDIAVSPGLVLHEHIPYAYQELDGHRTPVTAAYRLIDRQTYGFTVDDTIDPAASLVIDPLLIYSTYLGGSLRDEAWAIATDYPGNSYVTGVTWSSDLPVLNAIQPTHAGTTEKDVFIAKFNVDGSLIYATYYGGSNGDEGNSIAADAFGNAYVTGQTYSTNLPIANAWQPIFAGNEDAYVLKLDAQGRMQWATYLGGRGFEEANTVTVDALGRIYIGGEVYSDDFPLVNPWRTTTYGIEEEDGFLSIFDPQGQLIYSTYISAGSRDQVFTLAVDQSGYVLAAGMTSSPDFPVHAAIQRVYGGGWEDCFILKLNPWNNTLAFATFLGGVDRDSCQSIDFDENGAIYVSGYTASADFPTVNAYQPTLGGGHTGIPDAFVAKLTSSGNMLVYATFLGGSGEDRSWGLVTDHLGHAYITGQTTSADFPVRSALQPSYGGGDEDGFIAIMTPTGDLHYASYRGGTGHDRLWTITLDGSWIAHVAGESDSTNLATTDAYQPNKSGATDAIIDRFTFIPTPTPTPAPPPYASAQIGPEGGMLWLAYPNHLTVLQVPAGALSALTTFELVYDDRPNNQGALQGIDHCFALNISQPQNVLSPLRLDLAYLETRGVIANTIDLYRLEAGTWTTTGITIDSRVSNQIVAWISQPGVYNLLGQTNRLYLPFSIRE